MPFDWLESFLEKKVGFVAIEDIKDGTSLSNDSCPALLARQDNVFVHRATLLVFLTESVETRESRVDSRVVYALSQCVCM